MAWKLSKDERDVHTDLVTRLDKVTHALTDKQDPPTAEEITAYNQVVADVTNHTSNVSERLRNEFDDKSERWQESEVGESVNEFIETWEEHEIEELADDEDLALEDARTELTAALEQFTSLPEEAEL